MRFTFSVIGKLLSGLITVYSVIGIGGPVAFDFSTDGAMVTLQTSTDLSQT